MSPAHQCSLCARPDSEWLLSYTGSERSGEEGTREALLTLGNGYLASRGAAPEATADGFHYPATYVAGVYNRLDSRVDGHAWVLSRGDRPGSWRLLREALDADLADTQGGTTREGIHLGAMAATTDILQRCYTGLETRGDTLRLHPRLPDTLSRLEFDLRYRGHWLRFHLAHDLVDIEARPGAAAPVTITVDDRTHTLHSGAHLRVRLAEHPACEPGRPARTCADGTGV
jgi:trehalose/maltose hydrolase-like predicted phosphorylase